MSYLGLALSSNVAITSCATRPDPPAAGYRDIEPTILDTAGPEGTANAALHASEAALASAALAIATSLEALRTPAEDHFGYCAAGLTRSSDARRDLTRLGALCGPSNGLLAFEPAFQLSVSPAGSHRQLALARSQCVRLALVSENAGQRVRVLFRGLNGKTEQRCELEFGWCPPAGVFCGGNAGTELAIETTSADVQIQARLWALRASP